MLAVLAWWLIVTLMGWTAFPLAMRFFDRLPGRGYALAKALGLLLVSYVFWLLCSFKLLSNNVGGILIAWAVVLTVSLLAYRRGGGSLDSLREFVRERWRHIAATEVIFLVALVGWAIFRSFDPDLVGTEKPMEFAFLNAILRSDSFPPHDPWLSGYAISYYYYGYVIIAMLTRLAATPPAVAFNIGNALLFALTVVGSFGVVYELIAWKREKSSESQAIGFSLFAPLFVALVGNLEGLLDALHSRGIGTAAFWTWVQIKGLAEAPVTGSWIPQDHWWWWRASRVVYDTNILGQHSEIIDEFPYFSFILGDMHPHVLALPFIMLAIAVAVQVIRWAAEQKPLALPTKGGTGAWLRAWLTDDWPRTLLVALCLGALGFLNTWDFPIYWGLAALCYAAGRYAAGRRLDMAYWLDVALWAGRALILGVLLFLPFYIGFGSQASGIDHVLFNKTRPWHYFVMFGLFLVTSAGYVFYSMRAVSRRWTLRTIAIIILIVFAVGLYIAGIVAGLVVTALFHGKWAALVLALSATVLTGILLRWLAPIGARAHLDAVAWVAGILTGAVAVALAISALSVIDNIWFARGILSLIAYIALAYMWWLAQTMVQRQTGAGRSAKATFATMLGAALVGGIFLWTAVQGKWTALGVALIVALLALAVMRRLGQTAQDAGSDENALDDVAVALMMIVGFLLTFAVEFVFLRDYFGTRMNTVFKFYYQAWVLLGLGGAYALWAIFGRGERGTGRWAAVGRGIFAAVFALTLAASLVYTFAAGYTKANGFRGEATLNCLAFVQKYNPAEYEAIAWLNANIKGAPVILEATGGSYSEFARISARTGLPTLLGWDFHEQQWRGNRNPAGNRAGEIEALYRAPDSAESLTRLRTYGITYIYVGDLERNKYTLSEAVVNRWDNIAERVYDAGGVRIYRYSPMQ